MSQGRVRRYRSGREQVADAAAEVTPVKVVEAFALEQQLRVARTRPTERVEVARLRWLEEVELQAIGRVLLRVEAQLERGRLRRVGRPAWRAAEQRAAARRDAGVGGGAENRQPSRKSSAQVGVMFF